MRHGRRSPAYVTWFKWSFCDSISLIQVSSVFCAGSRLFHPWRASEWRMGPWGEALRHHALDKALLVEVWNSRVRAKFGLMYIRNEHKWRICFHAQILWKSVDLCGACGALGKMWLGLSACWHAFQAQALMVEMRLQLANSWCAFGFFVKKSPCVCLKICCSCTTQLPRCCRVKTHKLANLLQNLRGLNELLWRVTATSKHWFYWLVTGSYKAKHVKEIELVSFADESQNEWPFFLGNSLSCSTCGELGDGLTGWLAVSLSVSMSMYSNELFVFFPRAWAEWKTLACLDAGRYTTLLCRDCTKTLQASHKDLC